MKHLRGSHLRRAHVNVHELPGAVLPKSDRSRANHPIACTIKLGTCRPAVVPPSPLRRPGPCAEHRSAGATFSPAAAAHIVPREGPRPTRHHRGLVLRAGAHQTEHLAVVLPLDALPPGAAPRGDQLPREERGQSLEDV